MTELIWRVSAALDPDLYEQRDYPDRNALIVSSRENARHVFRCLRHIDCTNYSIMGDVLFAALRAAYPDGVPIDELAEDAPHHTGLRRALYDAAREAFQAVIEEAIADRPLPVRVGK